MNINYFLQIMQDADKSPSSKRWTALASLVMIAITWAANLFYGLNITEFIFDSLVWILIGALGITGVEKFSSVKRNQDSDNNQ